ncbi:TOBE-like domain-containing protein [Nesterenkonia pannonica]|uniref:sulfate/molybdate ABC transporter ATP-binding protein n=1 Tax=Nesterenkonia pannonica TaxID=1548602 RepID=UPI002164768C|nr:TOBE-like domain-containing protein [Nesterenkonia pannonica]
MALARALAIDPTVLLLDEPFGALDAKVRRELRDWLRRLHEDVHVTSVFVTHDQEEALEVADTVVVVNEGRIEQVGTPDEIYDSPATDFVFQFIGEATRLGPVQLRPHDVVIRPEAEGDGWAGRITRWNRIGFEVRLEVTLDASVQPGPVQVQLTRTEMQGLGIGLGDAVRVAAHLNAELRPV